MGLAPARVGGMAEKGWVAPPVKACGNFPRLVTDSCEASFEALDETAD